jgi:hypothetical protein
MAVAVHGHEAIAYLVRDEAGGPQLHQLLHIRPGSNDPQVLAAAEQAFRGIILPVVKEGMPKAVWASNSAVSKKRVYCLVVLLRKQSAAKIAIGIVVECETEEQAREKLEVAVRGRLRGN